MSSPVALSYSSHQTHLNVRDRLVLWLTLVGVAVLSLPVVFSAGADAYLWFTGQGSFTAAGWVSMGLEWALAVLYALSAITLGKSLRHYKESEALRRLLLVAFIAAVAEGMYEKFSHRTLPKWDLLATTNWAAYLAGGIAINFCLLLPVLLLGVIDSGMWRRRAIGLALAVSIAAGILGLAGLVAEGSAIRVMVGGTLGQGMQAALQRPAPIVGMWRLLGIVACGFYIAALGTPTRLSIRIAAGLSLAFVLIWGGINLHDRWGVVLTVEWTAWWLSIFLGELFKIIALAIPLTLIAWASTRDVEHLLEGCEAEGVATEAPATTSSE